MDGQASPVARPEWQAFLGAFQVRFRRPEGREAVARDTTGLLTALPKKNGDAIAQAVPGTSAQRLHALLTKRLWDAADLKPQRVQQRLGETTRGDGVLGCDETGVPTPGRASVGVARRSSGTLGQVGHGQGAVTGCSTDRQATWPVAVRVSWPQTWAPDPARRQQTRVPAEMPFQTTPAMALPRLEQARAWGVPHRGVVAAAASGEHPHCLAGLEARQAPEVVAVRTDGPVRVGQAATRPVWRADARLQTGPRWPWRTMRWRRGTTGWWRTQCVAVRGGRVTSAGPRHEGWGVGERAPRGQPAERKYAGRNLPPETPLDTRAGDAQRRHAMEPCHEEATGAWGWDQDQGRLWPGVQRHAVTVMRA